MKNLNEYIKNLLEKDNGICVAFSGGVDSSLILKVACDEAKILNKPVYAVTFETKLHPKADLEIAKKIALEVGAIHHVIYVNELENENILYNSVERCYHCKKFLFQSLIAYCKTVNVSSILDGTNIDDFSAYRPGIKALKELNIISPLAELKIPKQEVRDMAQELGLWVSKRPSTPCLATRLPYNTKVDFDVLEKIGQGEEILKNMGFAVNRIRLHNDIVRVEIKKEQFPQFMENCDEITAKLQSLGFVYVTLDLEGFRSGSMDVYINKGV